MGRGRNFEESCSAERIALAGLLVLHVFFSAACGSPSASESEPEQRSAELEVTRGTFHSGLLLSGELEAVEASRIIVPRNGWTWQMPIRWIEQDGAAVAKGQKVVELDNTQVSGNLDQNRLAESSALNDLMRKESDIAVDLADKEFQYEQARVTMEKARIEAVIPEHLRPRREHEQKQLDLEKAEIALEKATEDFEAARRAARAELEELRLVYEKARLDVQMAEQAIEALTLRAPRDGILVVAENRREERKYQTGDTVHVDQAVASIPELESMQVAARLIDVDDGKIATGMVAECVLDTYPDEIFTGEVIEITPVAKEQGRMSHRRAFRAIIRLDRTDPERMRPGMSVRAEVSHPERRDVLMAPRRALEFGEGAPRALLANGSEVEVQLGPCNATHCVVEDGLNEGQRLRARG